MAWQTPKTDWAPVDQDGNQMYFNLVPDYARIKGNIEYLRDFGNILYSNFDINAMEEYTIEDLPYSDFLNTVESNVELIASKTYSPPGFQKGKIFLGNDTVWNYKDLNRIENNLLLIYNTLNSQYEGMHTLAFETGITLGGGMV